MMAEITIEIPDELAQQLTPFQSQASDLFVRLVVPALLDKATADEMLLLSDNIAQDINDFSTYQEILDFLISRPTAQQIIDFKVSENSQARLQVLLERNRETTLNSTEISELNLYQQLDQLMGFLKIRAYSELSDNGN